MLEFIKIISRCDIEVDIEARAPKHQGWREARKFNSKNKIIGEYQLISKMERPYSLPQRIGRVCLGLLATVGSFGIMLVVSKSVRDLLTKDCETQRFGLYIPPHKPSNSSSSGSGDDLISGFFKILFTPADWFVNGMG